MAGELLRQQVSISQGHVYSQLQRNELAILQCDYLNLEGRLAEACRDNPIIEEKPAASCPIYPMGGGRPVHEPRDLPYDVADRSFDSGRAVKEQVGMELPEELYQAVCALIDCLDDRGFLRQSPRDTCLQLSMQVELFKQALTYLRAMGGGGLGCKGPGDYLAYQLRKQKKPLAWQKLCRENLSFVALKQYWLIAKTYEMDMAQARRCCRHIATLHPYPLRAPEAGDMPPVINRPDIRLDCLEGSWRCELVDPLSERYELTPRLQEFRLSCLSREECAYVQENAAKARFLLAALRRREDTLLRIGHLILDKQAAYLNGGPLAACPQSEAAEALGLHPSTLSRALRDKYVMLKGGLYPLPHFFQAGGGGGLSKQSIQDLIEGMLEEAQGERRLSDQAIAGLLSERHGVELSRRTVAKYRQERRLSSGYFK